jgi:hypothetical protein
MGTVYKCFKTLLLFHVPACFNINSSYNPFAECICGFCVDLKNVIISLHNVEVLVFVIEIRCLLRGTT